MADRRFLGVAAVLLAAILIVGGIIVTSGSSKGSAEIGVINMEAVLTQYVGPPLLAARDELQADFEAKSEELSEEEKLALFEQYQEQLNALEQEYQLKIDQAVTEVARENGVSMIVNSNAVVQGGVDLTDQVLEQLTKDS